jgi:dTDP-glucose 4,6-dehydratase
VRDWLFVDDHCDALELVLATGVPGDTYNIGVGKGLTNLALTRRILELLGKSDALIRSVRDRPGHDRRYSVDSSKVRQLGWHPQHSIEDGLRATVEWYRQHEHWWRPLKSGQFSEYYRRQYEDRLAEGLTLG